MKKLLSNAKIALALLVVTLVSLVFYSYMLLRPVSYGMGYSNKTVYDGGTFEGTLTFYSDDTMTNFNNNFNEELKSFYYYKDGFVFFTLAETEEDYNEEVAYINQNFDEAVDALFYANKTNAFRSIAEGDDGYRVIYTCTPAVVFAFVAGAVELILIGLCCASLILLKKTKNNITK